jgi:hypothetical protein
MRMLQTWLRGRAHAHSNCAAIDRNEGGRHYVPCRRSYKRRERAPASASIKPLCPPPLSHPSAFFFFARSALAATFFFCLSIPFGSFSKPPFPLFLSYQNASHFCGRDSSRSSRRVVAADLRLRKLLPRDRVHPSQDADLPLQWTTTWDRQSSLGYKNAGQSPVNFVATAGSADADITVDDSQVFQQMTAGFGGSLSKRDCVATALCQTDGVASRLECYGPEQHEGQLRVP